MNAIFLNSFHICYSKRNATRANKANNLRPPAPCKCAEHNKPTNSTAVGAYAIRPDCADLRCCCGGLRCGSCGGIKGVCNTPLQMAQNHNRPSFPQLPKNYTGHRKNYVLCRKNYIRHNSNYIRPFFRHLQYIGKQIVTKHHNNLPTLYKSKD